MQEVVAFRVERSTKDWLERLADRQKADLDSLKAELKADLKADINRLVADMVRQRQEAPSVANQAYRSHEARSHRVRALTPVV